MLYYRLNDTGQNAELAVELSMRVMANWKVPYLSRP